jgi:undecaprenyl-phosphate 4-deoxy-4-formamido-L-arabinose transferase
METTVQCSVVVPVYNSQDCLEELARRIDEVFRGINCRYELILVSDQSTDSSWNVIISLAKRNPAIIGISLRKNFGQDNAIMAGLRRARGMYVVIMDDDLQHDPVYIPRLIEEIGNGHDVVYARYIEKKQIFWKNAGSWFNDQVARIVLHKPKNVYLSPYKIIRADVVREICVYEGPYPYIDGLLFRRTAHFSQIEIEHQKRFQGSSTYTFWKSVKVWSYLATNFSIVPLRVATLGGMVAALAGISLGIIFIIHRIQNPEYPAGWASLIVSILIFSGVQLLSIGIAGEYIGRSYLNINRHPQYSIRETTGNQS